MRPKPDHPTSVAGAIGAASATASWYFANFASAAGHRASPERRTVRQGLRGLLRQHGVSALSRVAKCGLPIGGSAVALHRGADGVAHASGIETCASIWSCPVCSAKIRNHRSEEISKGLSGHIASGGGALFVTLTLPHEASDRLKRTVALVSDGFRSLMSGRAYREDHDDYGILGQIRAFEVTHTDNGWHPHLHVVVCLRRPATRRVADALQRRWQRRWDRWLIRQGWRRSVDLIGVRVDRVRRDEAAVAAYLAKLQEGDRLDRSVGNEMARSDLKSGRYEVFGSRTPLEILADFGSDGLQSDLDLWQEYQVATKGRSAIRWSKGLRALLLPDVDEQTDDEIATAEVGGDQIALIMPGLFRQIAARPYGEAYLLVAAERGGIEGIARYVRALGLDVGGVLYPEISTDMNGDDQQ